MLENHDGLLPSALCASKQDRFVNLGTKGLNCNQSCITAGQFTGDVPFFNTGDIESTAIGSCAPDMQPVLPVGGYRSMTIGFVQMVERIFGSFIMYDEAKIYGKK